MAAKTYYAYGGHICCTECDHGDFNARKCSIYGTPLGANLLCRHFSNDPGGEWSDDSYQSFLNRLEPGIIYEIDNEWYKSGNPTPAIRIIAEPIEPSG